MTFKFLLWFLFIFFINPTFYGKIIAKFMKELNIRKGGKIFENSF